MRKKWLINVDEDPYMRNITFDDGRSSKQFFIGVSLFLVFLVASGLPRDTENILVSWKNFMSGLSYKVSIFIQH